MLSNIKRSVRTHYWWWVIAVVSFAFLTRIAWINQPAAYVFDEVYHAVTAKLIARNDPMAYEWWNEPVEPNTAVDWLHPPLAKYTQALGVLIFGETPLGWRISAAVFGAGVVLLVVLLAKELFASRSVSVLAGLLASLDGLLLTQSRIAMNDIHVTFFILLTLLLYTLFYKNRKKSEKNNYSGKLLLLTGISAGLTLASKWSGLFVLFPLWLFEIGRFIMHSYQKLSYSGRLSWIASRVIILGLIPICVYVLSYSHMFWQGKSLFCFEEVNIQGTCYFERYYFGEKVIWEGYVSHFAELHKQIWWYQTHLEATHSYQSRPWQWFTNMRPVWFYVGQNNGHTVNIYAQGNTMLFWIGAVSLAGVLSLLYRLWRATKKPLQTLGQLTTEGGALLFILISYLVVWLPWQLSPRIMFFYHYTPAVPLLCILLAYILIKQARTSQQKETLAVLLVLLITTNFVLFYPHWTGQPAPKWLQDNVYYLFEGWR
ncbi:MAG: phospholipid carrier-dependent glycosyltransferase [Pseudomonadales bacterium]|nr:phospholipid carrier-dependent glycosyltransferase [Pseudomonadales bacterium]